MKYFETTVPRDNPTIAEIAAHSHGRTVSAKPIAPAPKSGAAYRILSHENGGVVLIGRNEAESVKLRTHAENRLRPMFNARRQEKSRFVPTGKFGWAVYFQSFEEMRQLFASLAFTVRARVVMNLGGLPPSFGEKDLARADKMIARFVHLEHKVKTKIERKRRDVLDLIGPS